MSALHSSSRAGFAHAHAREIDRVVEQLRTGARGLDAADAGERLKQYGSNTLPQPALPGAWRIFVRQFLSPLIYVLLAAALVSLLIREWADALFIFVVLLANALIGAYQEFSAQQAATALQQLVSFKVRVLRASQSCEVDAEQLVPGDIVLLESGGKVPADLRLWVCNGLEIDESLLTGESLPAAKQAAMVVDEDSALGDRVNMAFAGTLVTRGRASAVVVATGLATELGRIAAAVLTGETAKPPLLLRMERFTIRIAVAVGVAIILLALIALLRGAAWQEIFLLSVALAVSVIPEGLPVALTVALSVGMRRMARRHVIVRKLVAVEALGSCTFIASDKTGTLTVNELTVRGVQFPGSSVWSVSGEGTSPIGEVSTPEGVPTVDQRQLLRRICQAAVLSAEGFYGQRNGQWIHHGDAVDVALLVLAHKCGFTQTELIAAFPQIASIPFESQTRFAASLNRVDQSTIAYVKGAPETVLEMCSRAAGVSEDRPLDAVGIRAQAMVLANAGYRVLALASAPLVLEQNETFSATHLRQLTFLGLVAMIDPLRPQARAAVAACRRAGIEVSMVTGDHPVTALAIARELELAQGPEQVVTGGQLAQARQSGEMALDLLTAKARVFARVEPQQKLDIVQSLQRNGHFVAVTGDGANDAPALRAANVGVAMGQKGTDVARETADLIISDDNFISIVAGVEEGRIAYANVRKVIFLLISTGAAELVLFVLALMFKAPLPLVAVQLLWLNLVTNGIQDVALAFEPGEGHELNRPPRPPSEPIFNRLMLERTVVSALVIGGLGFGVFQAMLLYGYSEHDARNGLLLLMVLFENVQAFNSRSETQSVFRQDPRRNPLLLGSIIAAQVVHIGAMYTPGLSAVLEIEPIAMRHWLPLLALSLLMLFVMEGHKLLRRHVFAH